MIQVLKYWSNGLKYKARLIPQYEYPDFIEEQDRVREWEERELNLEEEK